MIERLYIERVAEGVYDVVCNDLCARLPKMNDTPFWNGYWFESAFEVLTDNHRDECKYSWDIAGVRVGYLADGMLGVVYGEHSVKSTEQRLPRFVEMLTKAGDE